MTSTITATTCTTILCSNNQSENSKKALGRGRVTHPNFVLIQSKCTSFFQFSTVFVPMNTKTEGKCHQSCCCKMQQCIIINSLLGQNEQIFRKRTTKRNRICIKPGKIRQTWRLCPLGQNDPLPRFSHYTNLIFHTKYAAITSPSHRNYFLTNYYYLPNSKVALACPFSNWNPDRAVQRHIFSVRVPQKGLHLVRISLQV